MGNVVCNSRRLQLELFRNNQFYIANCVCSEKVNSTLQFKLNRSIDKNNLNYKLYTIDLLDMESTAE